MSRHHKPRAFWRLARIWFRHIRITVWLLILLLLVVLLYLHNIGLPRFAERLVVRGFAEKGVVLDFSRIHLVWFKSIEADMVSVQPQGSGWLPRIECRKLALNFDPAALLRLRVVPRHLSIQDGRLILPFPTTNASPGELTATNLQAFLRFDPGMLWRLDSLRGELAGCELTASGTIANAQLIHDWRILQERAGRSTGSAHEIWRAVSQVSDQIEFLTAPTLRLGFDVDGAVPETLALWCSLQADAAASPWGLFEHPEVFARLLPLGTNHCSEVELTAQADQVSSPVGRGEYLTFSATLSCMAESGSLLGGRAAFSVHQLDTVWAGASELGLSLGWNSDGTNLIPEVAELNLEAEELSTAFGWAERVRVGLEASPFQGDFRHLAEGLGFPVADLVPFEISAVVAADRLESSFVAATNLAVAARWASPELSVTNLSVDWAGGHLDAAIDFNARSGRAQARISSDFDPQRLDSLLPHDAVVWLEQFTWREPPVVSGVAGVTLPPWHPHPLIWPGDLRPSLDLQGRFESGAGTFKGIPVSGASSHFNYSNMCWHLPDLTVRRPEGTLRLEHRNNDRTREFIWRVDGAVDPTPAMILVPEESVETREVLGTLRFGVPPEVHLAMAGSWTDLSTVEAWGTVRAADLAFRGCQFDDVEARLGLTNLTLTVSEPRVSAGEGRASAGALRFDFVRQLAFLSNGVSSMPPMTVATVIGPQVVKAIQAYQFLNPPKAQVEGVIPLKGVAGADMRFDLRGGPFRWQNFNLQDISGRVLWREETVALTNFLSEFYGGTAVGEAFFDFTGKRDADFWFNLRVNECDTQPLVRDVFQSTNRLEGTLSGTLSVTRGNTGDFESWFGYGHARLKDGYLWNAPIFGIVSPILDLLVPGLGSSRASEAEGRYSITNSVIRTDDLVIYTSNMRLLYAGSVDFKGKVDAVAEAEVLRDAILVGQLVSVVLTPLSKAMIIEITGSLAEPRARPLYLLPRVLLAPLNPVKMFKDVFVPPPPLGFEAVPGLPEGPPESPPPETDPSR